MTILKVQSEKTKSDTVQSKLVKPKTPVGSSDNKVYGTGRRKSAIARVWLKSGSGKVIVNKKNMEQCFTREAHTKSLLRPFVVTNTAGQYDIICTVRGGGISGQLGAVLHGVSRALDKIAPEFHSILRKSGFLTRDSRVVERKKYGKHKARKSTQFSKR
jgi:small subunit ribosomal protein S9